MRQTKRKYEMRSLPETAGVFDLSLRALSKNASHVRGLFLRVGSVRGFFTRKPPVASKLVNVPDHSNVTPLFY